ncbi:TPA: hypothetical protein ACKP33_001862 [Serratia marcescens]|jgi:hypothetical protein
MALLEIGIALPLGCPTVSVTNDGWSTVRFLVSKQSLSFRVGLKIVFNKLIFMVFLLMVIVIDFRPPFASRRKAYLPVDGFVSGL